MDEFYTRVTVILVCDGKNTFEAYAMYKRRDAKDREEMLDECVKYLATSAVECSWAANRLKIVVMEDGTEKPNDIDFTVYHTEARRRRSNLT